MPAGASPPVLPPVLAPPVLIARAAFASACNQHAALSPHKYHEPAACIMCRLSHPPLSAHRHSRPLLSPPLQGGFARPAPVPKMVADFVQFLYRHIRERNINAVFVMYRCAA